MRKFRGSSYLVLLLVASFVATAAPAGAVGFGVQGGLSVATLRGDLPTDGLVENGSKSGFGAGVWLAIPMSPNISLQPELCYVQKGTSLGKIDLTDSLGFIGGTADVLLTADYFEVPLLFRVSVPARGSISPHFLVGPVLGFRLSQQLRISGPFNFGTDIDVFKNTDVGFALGAGFELGRGPMRGMFEARYTLGLATATEDFYSPNAKNGALLVSMGLAIRR
jgi:hypothetical protein